MTPIKTTCATIARSYINESPSSDYFPQDVVAHLDNAITESAEPEHNVLGEDYSQLTAEQRSVLINDALAELGLEVNASQYL